jgi:RNA recognition motif-containing protein
MVRIFVGNLGTHCNHAILRSVFEAYGTVEEVNVARNFGLVLMADEAEAYRAMPELSDSSWFLQALAVVPAEAKRAA